MKNFSLIFQTSGTSSTPSTPGVSRSSTPAPPDHDDEEGSDEDEENQPPQITNEVTKILSIDNDYTSNCFFFSHIQRPSFPRAASASHLPLQKQFRAAAVAAANELAKQEPIVTDAVDDEISQITLRHENPPNKLNEKVDFGLPAHGAFSDPHDSQRQEDVSGDRKASISTQSDFNTPDVLKQTLSAKPTSSFEPTSGNPGDQQNIKSSATEQS